MIKNLIHISSSTLFNKWFQEKEHAKSIEQRMNNIMKLEVKHK